MATEQFKSFTMRLYFNVVAILNLMVEYITNVGKNKRTQISNDEINHNAEHFIFVDNQPIHKENIQYDGIFQMKYKLT